MEPRLTLITLGVANVARSTAFYERLGFERGAMSNPNVSFFQAGGAVLALFDRLALARDAGLVQGDGDLPTAPRFGGVSLAHNVASPQAVDQVLAQAVQAGATLVKPGQSVFWGGDSGYFQDPDGHLWEVAHNPFLPLDAAGLPNLPPAGDA